MNKTKSKPRSYNKITPKEIAEYKALKSILGNGSSAARALTPNLISPGDRAFRIEKKSEKVQPLDFIETKLQQIGQDAVQRIGLMVNSSDERIATRNSHYVLDQLRGQATRKSVNLSGKLNIENVLK